MNHTGGFHGANSQMVAIITGKTIREEATEATRTYDLVASIRATRLRWLGQILRMGEDRLVKKAVRTLHMDGRVGDILMDAPKATWRELCLMAADEKGWQQKVNAIKANVHFTIKSKTRKKGGEDGGKKRRERDKKKGKGDDDSDDSDEGNGWGRKKTRPHNPINSVVRCYDGFRMSVQASRDHCCIPRQDAGPYTHVEVAYPNWLEERLLPYADGATTIAGLRPTLYVNVPAEVVLETIEAHAGMLAGQLPELAARVRTGDSSDSSDEADAAYAAPTSVIHLGAPSPPPPSTPSATSIHLAPVRDSDVIFDTNGEMWAAACEPPDDTPSTIMLDSDISVGVTMGSPLAPSMYVMGLGILSPPPALTSAAFSPIQTPPTNLLMIEDKKEEDQK